MHERFCKRLNSDSCDPLQADYLARTATVPARRDWQVATKILTSVGRESAEGGLARRRSRRTNAHERWC